MKTLITKSKSNLILALALMSGTIWAKPVAQITEMKGKVFLISKEGKPTAVKVNDHINNQAELMVEENGSVTLNDYFNVTYHLTSSSRMTFYERSVQLKNGKAWIQSFSARNPLSLTTSNGHVGFHKGEFIATFDPISSKTQILVVSGEVDVANVLDNQIKHTLTAGTFSVLDPEVDDGLPRSPTKVGLNSLNKALAEFKTLPEELKKDIPASHVKREIASVNELKTPQKKGEIIFISSSKSINRVPASAKVPKNRKHDFGHAKINYYGMSSSQDSERNPASISKIRPELHLDPEFEKNLREAKGTGSKYSKELESLIQDLQSY